MVENRKRQTIVPKAFIKEVFGKHAKNLYLKGLVKRVFRRYKVDDDGNITEIFYVKTLHTTAELFLSLKEKIEEIEALKEELRNIEGDIAEIKDDLCTNVHEIEQLSNMKKKQRHLKAAIEKESAVYLGIKKNVDAALEYVLSVFNDGFFWRGKE